MSDEQARMQLLSCLEDAKLDLEELKQHSSAVVVGQAIEMIEGYALRLVTFQNALLSLAATYGKNITFDGGDHWRIALECAVEDTGEEFTERCVSAMNQAREIGVTEAAKQAIGSAGEGQ